MVERAWWLQRRKSGEGEEGENQTACNLLDNDGVMTGREARDSGVPTAWRSERLSVKGGRNCLAHD